MAYEPYADAAYYSSDYGGKTLTNDDIDKYLKQSSRHIDSLTYNRIVGRGFDNLTAYQQEIIKEVVCLQAEFEYENEDLIENVLQSYSINGVSMSFGGASWNIYTDKGVAMRKDTYGLLSQTGLCCRLMR